MQMITTEERRSRLGRRHLLAQPAATVEDVADALMGLHSSDPATPFLSCQARIDGFTVEDLEESLYEDRALLRMLGMRRTMFVVPPTLGAVVDAACAQRLHAPERRRLVGYLEQHDIASNCDAWLADVETRTMQALGELGAATANELKTRVPELGIQITFGHGKKWGGRVGLSTRVLFLLAAGNRIVRVRPLGSWVSTQYRWTRTDTWLDDPFTPMTEQEAQTELVGRWLRTYGPGTFTDIKWWTGWGVGLTKAALGACESVEVDLDGEVGYLAPDDHGPTDPVEPWAALLPSLDSTVMGWKDRDWYLGSHRADLYDRNGNAGPTIWLNGRIIGGWAQSGSGEVRLEYLESADAASIELVQRRAAELQRWLGERRFVARFRTPTERRLTG
ncbi:MAG: winged helix DNA-binding domain-containing protein [bacterium]|nr:winged helix DNA-binding domain-containing protein [bacterium]